MIGMLKIEKKRNLSVDIEESGVGKRKIGMDGESKIIGKLDIGFMEIELKKEKRRGDVEDKDWNGGNKRRWIKKNGLGKGLVKREKEINKKGRELKIIIIIREIGKEVEKKKRDEELRRNERKGKIDS